MFAYKKWRWFSITSFLSEAKKCIYLFQTKKKTQFRTLTKKFSYEPIASGALVLYYKNQNLTKQLVYSKLKNGLPSKNRYNQNVQWIRPPKTIIRKTKNRVNHDGTYNLYAEGKKQ